MAQDSAIPATTLAYMAGMIDGDGFVTITRSTRGGVNYFAAQVGIGNTIRTPLDMAAALWGGSVRSYAPANPRHRVQYQWQRMGASAAVVLRDIFPYLVVKSEHALLALELHQITLDRGADDPFPWFGPDYDPEVTMHAMREQMIDMNQSRSRARREFSR